MPSPPSGHRARPGSYPPDWSRSGAGLRPAPCCSPPAPRCRRPWRARAARQAHSADRLDSGLGQGLDQQKYISGAAARHRRDRRASAPRPRSNGPYRPRPSARGRARSAPRSTCGFATRAAAPWPIAAGVLGIARTTGVAAPNAASKRAIVVPAAIERTTAPLRASARISRQHRGHRLRLDREHERPRHASAFGSIFASATATTPWRCA